MRLLKLLLVLFACAAAVPAVAGPLTDEFFEEAVTAHGKGDYHRALDLFATLAKAGNAAAQFNLGLMLDRGQGIPPHHSMAMSWYRMAAEKGLAMAQFTLGFIYDNGKGVPQDYAMAALWYRKAADQGLADAQNNLGRMYSEGQGVPLDYVQAHMWFNLAASRAPEDDLPIKNRNFVAAKMTSAQITQAQKLAREWKPKPER